MFGFRAASSSRAFTRSSAACRALFQRSACQRAVAPSMPAASWSLNGGQRLYGKEVDAEAVNKLVMSNTSIDEIEKDLARMFAAESKEVKESEGYSTFQMQKKLLEENGYSLNVEYGQYVTMRRTDGDRTIELEWSTAAEEDEEDEDDENEIDEYDDEEQDVEENEHEEEEAAEREEGSDRDSDNDDFESDSDDASDDEEEGLKDVQVRVTVTKGEDSANSIAINCTAGSDGQWYVESMGPAESQSVVETEELPTDLTHRVYDYLEQLGIGNGTATFIQHYNYFADADQEVEAMDHIVKAFSQPKSK